MTTTETLERTGLTLPDDEIYSITELGTGLKLLKRKNDFELTAENAEKFLRIAEFNLNDEKVDRRLQDDWVIHLAREMIAGTFRWEQVSLATCTLDGHEVRMNGQHTCWARLQADDELRKQDEDNWKFRKIQPPKRYVQWLRYEAATEQDMRQLYATMDRGKPRGRGMVVTSYLSGSDEFPGYSKGNLRMLASGLALWLWETSRERKLHSPDEVSYLMLKDYHKLCLRVGTIIRESRPADFKHMRRGPVIGAMFATIHKAPEKGQEFWRTVRDGTGFEAKDDPRLTLRNYLMLASLAVGQMDGTDSKVVSEEDMHRACLMAWNAWRAERPLKLLKPGSTEGRPEVK